MDSTSVPFRVNFTNERKEKLTVKWKENRSAFLTHKFSNQQQCGEIFKEMLKASATTRKTQ